MNQSIDASDDTFRILITTDNHIGYCEKDGLRGSDSIKTFEEILQYACSNNVDFILNSGDLFHDNRPSIKSTHEVIRLLRKYCHGTKPVEFELLSDPKCNFNNTSNEIPNYLDSNINIGIPVFMIYGNHDDPSGPGGLCSGDILHTSGLANLFGKSTSIEKIDVNPILLRKGKTHLALYGIGSVKEERLHRLFLNNLVTFYRPSESENEWFSICAVHQNRVRHGPTNFLPEQFLPNFLDLVVWGHEHECRIEPEWNSNQNFYLSQPGSSIATSLSVGESLPKAVGLLEIRKKEFKLTRIPLLTVRPFLFCDLVLQNQTPTLDPNSADINKQIESICTKMIESEINKATNCSADALTKLSKSHSTQVGSDDSEQFPRLIPPPEPLIRLRIDTSGGYETFSAYRFGQKFVGRVANPKDLVVFNRNKEKLAAAQVNRAEKSALLSNSNDESMDSSNVDNMKVGLNSTDVEKLVKQFLIQMNNDKDKNSSDDIRCGLSLFTTQELEKGMRVFVDRGLSDAIHTTMSNVQKKALQYLRKRKVAEEHIVHDIISYCHLRIKQTDQEEDLDALEENVNLSKPVSNVPKSINQTTNKSDEIWSSEDDEHQIISESPVKKTKKSVVSERTVGRKKVNGKTNRPASVKSNQNFMVDSDEDEQEALAALVEDDDNDDDEYVNAMSTIRSPSLIKSTSSTKSARIPERGVARGRVRGVRSSQKRLTERFLDTDDVNSNTKRRR